MKQEIITYISTFSDMLFDVSKYIHDNPEESFHEHKACNYVVNILKQYNFKVTTNYLQMATSFYAEYGSNHPRICYLCEYDAIKDKGHVTGHNLVTSMSLGAAIGLTKIIDKIGGSVVIIGCPGEYLGGSKATMVKQGTFNDIDIVLMAHPDVDTYESGTSSALLPLCINYKNSNKPNDIDNGVYSALDACLFTLTGIKELIKGFPTDIKLDGFIASGGIIPNIEPSEANAKFYISACDCTSAQSVETKIKEFIKTTASLMNIEGEISLCNLPHKELVTNKVLSRIFSHNLKENGIIDVKGIKNIDSGISIGSVSHIVPTIHPYIGICDKSNIKFSSQEFRDTTLTKFAKDRIINAAETLAITGMDIIAKEDLLNEIRQEFYSKTNNN